MLHWRRDDGKGTRSRAGNRFHLSVGRTSHRIWVAFRALKSSGVSSSTVSPLPFTPSSRSFLYSFYRNGRIQKTAEKNTRAGRAETDRRHFHHLQTFCSIVSLKVTESPTKHPSYKLTNSLIPNILVIIEEKEIRCLIIQFFSSLVTKFTLDWGILETSVTLATWVKQLNVLTTITNSVHFVHKTLAHPSEEKHAHVQRIMELRGQRCEWEPT